jgi:hypothetical protein
MIYHNTSAMSREIPKKRDLLAGLPVTTGGACESGGIAGGIGLNPADQEV